MKANSTKAYLITKEIANQIREYVEKNDLLGTDKDVWEELKNYIDETVCAKGKEFELFEADEENNDFYLPHWDTKTMEIISPVTSDSITENILYGEEAYIEAGMYMLD